MATRSVRSKGKWVCGWCSGNSHSECPSYINNARMEPSQCNCGCSYSLLPKCIKCGNRNVQEVEGGLCIDPSDCQVRATARTTTRLAELRVEYTVNNGVVKVVEPKRDKLPSSTSRPQPCHCGCGETTGGGMFKPGHDAKHLSNTISAIRSADTSRDRRALLIAEMQLRGGKWANKCPQWKQLDADGNSTAINTMIVNYQRHTLSALVAIRLG